MPSATVAPSASATPPSFFGDVAVRLAWFDKLVAEIRRLHVFTAQVKTNLGRTFDDELPGLRDEVVAATDTEHVVGALHHLANALHNAHSFFDPARRGTSLDLGVTVRTEWQGDQVRFYVAKVQRPPVDGTLAEDDYIESVDGTQASALLTGLLRESDANNWRGVAKDEARYLTSRSTSRSLVREDQRTSWTVSGKGGSQKVTLVWRKSAGGGDAPEFAVDYATTGCAGLPERDYDGYTLAARGRNLCVYTSTDPTRRAWPIVRHFSFNYIDNSISVAHQSVRADHDVVTEALARVGKIQGVIVDLRDNGGGNNPNWFLDWYAHGTYVDRFVRLRVPEAGDVDVVRKLLGFEGPTRDFWEAALRTPSPDGLSPLKTFFCKESDCTWDNRYTPSHPVTSARVALLLGPGCASACDSVAQIFAENDFGPTIGEPTAAAYTSTRLRWPVTLPDGTQLGVIHLAFADDVSGKTKLSIEAVPLALTRPIDRTRANDKTYDRQLVEAAIGELKKRKKT